MPLSRALARNECKQPGFKTRRPILFLLTIFFTEYVAMQNSNENENRFLNNHFINNDADPLNIFFNQKSVKNTLPPKDIFI